MNKRWVLISFICAMIWGGVCCLLAYKALDIRVSYDEPKLLLFISMAYLCFSTFLVAYFKRYWLIPILLLLPVIILPGVLGVVSFFGELSFIIFHALSLVSWRMRSLHTLLLCALAPSLFVLFLWVAYGLWRRKYLLKHGMIQLSFIALISLLLWSIALGFNTMRASNTVRYNMGEINTTQSMRKDKNGTEMPALFAELRKVSDAVNRKYPDFQPPVFGRFKWLKSKKDVFFEKQDKIIKQTLEKQDSAEVKLLYAALDALPSQAPFTGNFLFLEEKDSEVWMNIQEMGCHFIGRAQIAHYSGKTDEILPPLERMRVLDEILQNTNSQTAEMLRGTIYKMRTDAILSLGPVDEKYAPFYAKELEASLKREIVMPSELEESIFVLRHYLEHINKPSKYSFDQCVERSFLRALLLRPLKLRIGCMKIRNELLVEKYISESHPVALSGLWHGEKAIRLLNNSRMLYARWQVFAQCVFALKLYHCRNGHYPEKMEQLVPDIVKSLPIEPYHGRPMKCSEIIPYSKPNY